MIFKDWAYQQGFTEADLSGPLHELEGCWNAAQEVKNDKLQKAEELLKACKEAMQVSSSSTDWSKMILAIDKFLNS